jgi:hypothetical protein
MEKLED